MKFPPGTSGRPAEFQDHQSDVVGLRGAFGKRRYGILNSVVNRGAGIGGVLEPLQAGPVIIGKCLG